MSFGKVARKLKRVGKTAVQFRFTSTFEYIELNCNGTWRPDNLRVIWLRSHRRVQSIDVQWVPTEDRGPNGAEGKAAFNPPLSVALIVTLYRDSNVAGFQSKEYKYYIENDGPGGKKILASFNCDMAEYVGIPTSKNTLDMTFKSVSRKIDKAVLGITLESEFIKQGTSLDDDMQSTFSSMSAGRDSLAFDDEDDDEEVGAHAAARPPPSPQLNKVAEETESEETDQPLATPETTPQPGMGPAQVLDADISKPADPGPSNGVLQELEPSDAAQLQAQNTEHTAVSVNGTNEEASSAGAGAKYLSSSIQLIQKGTVNVFVGKFEKNQGEAPSSPSSFAKRHQETPSKEELNGPAKQEQPSIEEVEEPPEREQPPVEKVDEPPEPEQPVKEEQVEAVGDESPDPSMSLTKKAENFMAGVQRKERLDSPSPELPEMQSSEPTLEKESEKLTPPKPPRTNSRRKNRGGEIVEVEQNGDSREYETEEQSSPPGNTFDAFDFVFETSKLIVAQMKQGQSQQQPTATGTSESPSSRNRITVQSKEEYVPPPNPYLEDGGAGEEAPEEISPTASWLGDASFIDCFGEPVWRQKLDNAEIIGLYFSANWCPPCRRFLPKLVKFYHHLKQHNKSFEILYISSDYSKQEMLRYMEEQQMPWVGLAFNSSIADKLRADFSVSAIPLFTVVSTSGIKLEESAKKSVEASTSSSGVLKLYNKWYERLQGGGVDSSVEEKQKKGLFQKVKDAVKSPGKDDSMDLDNSASQSPTPDSKDYQAGATQGSRQTVEDRPRQKSKSKSHPATSDLLEEKEDRIRYLEEVNMSLKQTNDDLNEEVAELRRTLAEAQQKLGALEESSRQLEDEKRELIANLNIRGWLFKRGLKGPTANVWRRRFFRCDQGSKIYYYKSATEGQPQGFIDLDKVISCQEVSAAQQDKNHATFLVQCDGRTYQLQAHDEATMRKWMGAIEYLRAWRKRHGTISAGTL